MNLTRRLRKSLRRLFRHARVATAGAAILVGASALHAGEYASAQSPYFSAECEPRWTVSAAAVAFTRSRPDDRTLLLQTATGDELLAADGYHFDWQAGPDLRLRRRIGERGAIELRHLQVADMTARQSVDTGGAFTFPSNPPLMSPIGADIDTIYASRFYSTEANLLYQPRDWFTWIAGFRYIELHENLDFAATLLNIRSGIDIDTDNHLYGAQLGGEFRLWDRGGPFTVEGMLKGGIFGNAARQQTTNVVHDPSSVVMLSTQFNDRQSTAAFVGEFGVTARYALTDTLSLTAGYQGLLITDAALASDQVAALDINTLSGIDNSGIVLYHGALLGLEWRR